LRNFRIKQHPVLGLVKFQKSNSRELPGFSEKFQNKFIFSFGFLKIFKEPVVFEDSSSMAFWLGNLRTWVGRAVPKF
jgi:hypothetical protein